MPYVKSSLINDLCKENSVIHLLKERIGAVKVA